MNAVLRVFRFYEPGRTGGLTANEKFICQFLLPPGYQARDNITNEIMHIKPAVAYTRAEVLNFLQNAFARKLFRSILAAKTEGIIHRIEIFTR